MKKAIVISLFLAFAAVNVFAEDNVGAFQTGDVEVRQKGIVWVAGIPVSVTVLDISVGPRKRSPARSGFFDRKLKQ